jgi:hypothetical protein
MEPLKTPDQIASLHFDLNFQMKGREMRRNWIVAVGLVLAIGLLGFASVAAAEEAPPASVESASPTAPAGTGKLSPLAKSQCSENTVCVWAKINYEGGFSQWAGSETGCHSHAGNPGIKSWWNRTGYTVRLGGWGNVGPHEAGSFVWESETPITGEICWPA